MAELTAKRRAWLEEYLQCWNATEAARRVGFAHPNTQGPRLLLDVSIQDAIQGRINEKAMTAAEILERVTDIARGDIADLLEITPTNYELALMVKDEFGNLVKNPKTKLIKKIKQKTTTFLAKNESGEDKEIVETEIELYSALEALQMLGKHRKVFVERNELTGAGGGPVEIQRVIINMGENETPD